MKSKPKSNNYKKIMKTLEEIHKLYPSYTMGKHISTALGEYPDIWGLSDKEVLYAFTKYKAQLELDIPHEADEEELEKIIQGGMDLTSAYTDEEEVE